MVKKRIIPVILLRNGLIVQSRLFKRHQLLGTPTAAVERLSNWESDELIYLDISPSASYDLNRSDLNHPEVNSIEGIIKLVSVKCLMPLTFGGGIRKMEDVDIRINTGADKVSINTLAIEQPKFITEAAKKYGSQAIVISMDVKKEEDNAYAIYKRGKERTDLNPVMFARQCEDLGAGEILLNAVHNDGAGQGFDIELINLIASSVKIPVIAIGGAGKWEHFEEVLEKTNAAAVAAANIFQHSENSYFNCRQYLFNKKYPVRKPGQLSSLNQNL